MVATGTIMSIKDLLGHPAAYRLWQAPFAAKKIAPVLTATAGASPRSVLDIGCGPGTNAPAFSDVNRYVGVDISERYIGYARKNFRGDFRVADVTRDDVGVLGQFDLVLMNSLMHHVDDMGANVLLGSVPNLLAPGGQVHIIDLVLPDRGLPRRMALLDRGEFPRTVSAWVSLASKWLRVVDAKTYEVGLGALALWELVHLHATSPAAPE